MKIAFDMSLGSFWVVFSKKNQILFIILAHRANLFQHCVEDFTARLLENTILFFNPFRILSEQFPLFWQKKAVGLSKLLPTCLQEQFENKKFLKKNLKFLLSFPETKRTKVWFSSIFFPMGCRKCLLRVHRNFCVEKYFFEKLYSRFQFFCGSWPEKILVYRQAFLSRVVPTAFDLSMDSFWVVFLKKKSDTFYHSRKQSKPFSAFSRFFSNRVVRKNYLYFLFSKKGSKATNTAFTMFKGTVSKKSFFWKKVLSFFYFFGHWAKKLRLFMKVCPVRLSNVCSTCP